MKSSENIIFHDLFEQERLLWNQGLEHIAGVDEAGRGPLAGPVVAAAVVFRPGIAIKGINDSKKLSPPRREILYDQIQQQALSTGIGIVHEKEIDRINILQAALKAMTQAVGQLDPVPNHLLIDGNQILKAWPGRQTALVKGDQKSYSIAAASILAKVTRDRIMVDYDARYPEYGFAKHKGYGTRTHIKAIQIHGRCPIHRISFHVKGIDD